MKVKTFLNFVEYSVSVTCLFLQFIFKFLYERFFLKFQTTFMFRLKRDITAKQYEQIN